MTQTMDSKKKMSLDNGQWTIDNDSDSGLEEEDEFGQWTMDNDSDSGLEEEDEFGQWTMTQTMDSKKKMNLDNGQ